MREPVYKPSAVHKIKYSEMDELGYHCLYRYVRLELLADGTFEQTPMKMLCLEQWDDLCAGRITVVGELEER